MTYLPAYIAVTAGVVLALDAAHAVLRYAATGHAPRPYSAVTDRWEEWRDAQIPPPAPPTPQALSADLRRLADEVQAVTASSRPAKALHLRAALLAYDDALLRACRELHVGTPEGARSGMSPDNRFRTESALLASGFEW